MIQWDAVPVLAEAFGMSRTHVRRDLAAGGFYLKSPDGWERLAAGEDDCLEADGLPALAFIRHGKRDLLLVEFAR